MAVLSSKYLTMTDWAKRRDPNGGTATIVEALAESNPVIKDALVVEGNLATGHRSAIRTGLPTPTWTDLYGGIQPSKSTTKQVDDVCGTLEALSKVAVNEAELEGNTAAFRASEDITFLESMTQEVAAKVFYGNVGTDPKGFHGIAPRYDSYQTTDKTLSSYNCIDAEGTGSDNTSIYLVTWKPKKCFLIFPKGTRAGLESEDLGKILTDAPDGSGEFMAWVTYYKWRMGLVVQDWRYCVRIANIDVSDLTTDAATGANLLELMVKAYHRIPTVDLGKTAKQFIYCSKSVGEYLDHQAINRSNLALKYTESRSGGGPVTAFRGIPVRVCDQILDTESAVSAA